MLCNSKQPAEPARTSSDELCHSSLLVTGFTQHSSHSASIWPATASTMNLATKPCGLLDFLSLPEELQVEILIRMDYRSLLRCTLVSSPTVPQPIVDSYVLDARYANHLIIQSRNIQERNISLSWVSMEWKLLPTPSHLSNCFRSCAIASKLGRSLTGKDLELFPVETLANVVHMSS